MAVSWKGDAAITFSAASITPAMPTHASGDMLLAIWMGKPFNGSVSVSGWTDLGSAASGSTAAGVDSGSMKAQVWWKEATSSVETAPTFTEGATVWDLGAGCVVAWQKGGGDTWSTPVVVYGGDEGLDKDISATMSSDPGVTAADGIQLLIGCNSDATSPVSALTVTQASVTFGAVTTDQNSLSTGGGDGAGVTGHCLVTSGTGSAAPVITATGTADPGSPRMEAGFIRLRVTAAPAGDSPTFHHPDRSIYPGPSSA